mgnify:FL=1
MEKIYEIYKLTNLVNNKIYVGATTEGASYRFRRHVIKANGGGTTAICNAIREYGENNFKIETIELCKDLAHMNERENYWIVLLGATNPEIGYNNKLGGGVRFQSDETKEKIGILHRGKISENRKPILQYDINGIFVKEYPSIEAASEDTGISKTSIYRILRKQAMKPSKKNPYVWILSPDNREDIKLQINIKDYYMNLNYVPKQSEEFKRKRALRIVENGDMNGLSTPVEQYDLKGNLIAKYGSISDASKASGISGCTIRKYINDPEYINKVPAIRRRFNWKYGKEEDRKVIDYKELGDIIATKRIRIFEVHNTTLSDTPIRIEGIRALEKYLRSDFRTIKKYLGGEMPTGYWVKEIINN